jgi:tetratricopeptide (TPR) repeat protein
MKRSFAFAAVAATLFSAAPADAVTMIYNVDPSAQCSQTARDITNLKVGLAYCDEALRDDVMLHRGALLINRGIIKFAMDDTQGALKDFNAGLIAGPQLGDGYINRAALLISLGRYDEARGDVDKALQLGAVNIPVAYYNRGVIEDETGDYQAAYRDYKQALALKPDYAAAARELLRFKTAPGASTPPR